MAFATTVDDNIKQYVGKWTFNDYTVELQPEKKEKVMDFFKDMYVQFNEDMSYEAKVMGEEEKGTWTIGEEPNTLILVNSEGNERKMLVTIHSPEQVTLDMGYGGFLMDKEKEEEEKKGKNK